MKWAVAFPAILLGIGMVAHAVTIGLGVGYETSGLILAGALTETPISRLIDVRVQVGFAMSDIAGLMLVTMDLLTHWTLPPLGPYVGIGIGAALTPPPFSTGLVVEGLAGTRAAVSSVVWLFLQARYLLRWTRAGFNAGPVLEGGLLVRF